MPWRDPMRHPHPVAATQTPRLTGVLAGGDEAAWGQAGFHCSPSGFRAGEVSLFIGAAVERPALRFSSPTGSLEGLIAKDEAPDSLLDLPNNHPNGTCGVDHVVVSSPNIVRTGEAMANAGLELLGTRSAEIGGRKVEQRFHRAGSCLIELVGEPGSSGDGSPSIWGITFVTERLGSLPALDPPPVASIRDAVQPGRRIATVVPEIHLPIRVAFMDPRQRKPEA